VIIGIEESADGGRVLIADGRRVSAKKPKRKNLRHVEAAGKFSAEAAERLAGGKCLDDGWIAEILHRLNG
jgi:ribosomal protein L14E/L6E/L27E